MDLRYLIGGVALCMMVPVGEAVAQTDAVDDEAHSVTLVGCIMRESDFREMYGPGQSGPRGPGIGLRNEYMLVDAHPVTPSGSNPGVVETTGTCPPAPGGFPTAYELTGPREKEVASFLGHRVELTGMQKRAKTRAVGTSGLREPTGGFDPLGHELHLFEVEVASFRDAPVAAAAAAVTTPAPAPEPVAPAEPVAAAPPAPAPEAEVAAVPPPAPAPPPEAPVAAAPPPAPAPEPAPQTSTAQQAPPEPPRQVAQAALPKTASPLPIIGLIGLLSLTTAAGMRLLRRRS